MTSPLRISDAEVVLHLLVDVAPAKRRKFLAFCRRAFPVYETVGGCRMVLYEDKARPGRFDEVGYYRTKADYRRSENAIRNHPAQAVLIKEWRSLLSGPAKASVYSAAKTR
jgi:hypothetical protein